jgi:hypothetical protein
MATSTPVKIIGAVGAYLTTTATDTAYAVPANATLTISQASANNTTATNRTVTVYFIPPAGTASAEDEVASDVPIPAGVGAVALSQLVGCTLPTGTIIQMVADAATAVTAKMSGYLTTP